jgi:hypothetical protein
MGEVAMSFKIFRKCARDDRYDWKAYVRVGLYYLLRSGERKNFCDIHIGWYPGSGIDTGIFSGPTDAMKDVKNLPRTKESIERYRNDHDVRPGLTITNGGIVKFMHSAKRKTIDAWLLGPLQFEGRPYGSLVAELEGLSFGKATIKWTTTDPKTHKERDLSDPQAHRYLVTFPKNYAGHFHGCKLLASTYADGMRPHAAWRDNVIWDGGTTVHYKDDCAPGEKNYIAPGPPPPLEAALGAARGVLSPALLPREVVRVEWKVEDYADQQTECQTYDRHG